MVATLAMSLLVISAPAARTSIDYSTSGPRYNLHYPVGIVYVEDHTGSAWPVRAATRVWDQGTDVSVRYGKCRATAGCVRVYEGRYGMTKWVGSTSYHWNTVKHVFQGSTITRLNNSYRLTARTHQQIASHELGHALGLMYHSSSRGTCMFPRADPKASMWGNGYDKRVLNTLY